MEEVVLRRVLCLSLIYEVEVNPFSQPVVRFAVMRFPCFSNVHNFQLSWFRVLHISSLASHTKCHLVRRLSDSNELNTISGWSDAVVVFVIAVLYHLRDELDCQYNAKKHWR